MALYHGSYPVNRVYIAITADMLLIADVIFCKGLMVVSRELKNTTFRTFTVYLALKSTKSSRCFAKLA